MSEMAIFPLMHPLLPGMFLPLNIFEPRYVQMYAERSDANPPFGVVMIERDAEVGGGDVRSAIGCTAHIVSTGPGPAIRIDVVGHTRFRIDRWLPDDPYPQAEVTPWPDDPGDGEMFWSRCGELQGRYESLGQLASRHGFELPHLDWARPYGEDAASADATANYLDLATERAWKIALAAPIGALDRFNLLNTASLAPRVDALIEVLDDQIAVLTLASPQ